MGSPTWSMDPGAALPTNRAPSRMCTIRPGSNPISRAQVASTPIAMDHSVQECLPQRKFNATFATVGLEISQ
jgi:hypothetical protein